MSVNKFLEELSKPFDEKDVKWRLQGTNADKTGGWAVAYLDSRAIAKRLDDVVGQMRWKDEYKPWITSKTGASQICIISIYDDDIGEWVNKSDGAELSAISPIKGGISDAFKRAAVKWGIGRYLYSMKPVWVKTRARGNSAMIEDTELTRLQQQYSVFLKESVESVPKQTPQNQIKSFAKPTSNPVPVQNTPMYEILGVKKQQGDNGVRSMLRIKHNNKIITAYYNGDDSHFKEGANLSRALFTSRETEYGKVHILQDYDLAA